MALLARYLMIGTGLVWGLLATAQAQPADYIDASIGVLEAGQYCPAVTIDRRPSPGTSAGHTDIIADKPTFLSTTRVIEARPNNTFGVYTQLKDPLVSFTGTIRITHPPFGNADATTVELDTSGFSGSSSSGYTFTFDYPYEIVTGIWTFEALDGDVLLYRISFTVIPPTSPGAHGCDPAPIS